MLDLEQAASIDLSKIRMLSRPEMDDHRGSCQLREKTKSQKVKQKEADLSQFFRDILKRASAVRGRDREFHGLEREFFHHQAEMIQAYSRSKDVHHARDVGDIREDLLKSFFERTGLLPSRFAVAKSRARVASTTGHVSREMDLVFYDALDTVSLMRRENLFEVLPVESVFGAIQIKSKLNKGEISAGLKNIASLKRLDRAPSDSCFSIVSGTPKSDCPFGVLFAYDSDLEWSEMIAEIKDFAALNPKRYWVNLIYILGRGLIFHGHSDGGAVHNSDIEAIEDLVMQGRPDQGGISLFTFFSIVLNLLRQTSVRPADVDQYLRLPLVAGNQSYEFSAGMFAEFGTCEKHGDYQRTLTSEKLERLVAWCRAATPINWVKAIHLAYGLPEDPVAYERQPGDVLIYNPEHLPLSGILIFKRDDQHFHSNAFDHIKTDGLDIFLPYYYSVKEGMICGCPKCESARRTSQRRRDARAAKKNLTGQPARD